MKKRLGLFAAGMFAVPLLANAAIISTTEFIGNAQEGFEDKTLSSSIAPVSVFNGDASLSFTQTANTSITVTTSYAGGELGFTGSQPVVAYEGTKFAGISGYGFINFNFSESINSFGGYFNSLFRMTESMPNTVSFYENDILLETLSFATGFGNWLWQGWAATDGETFDRIEINSNVYRSALGFVLMDSLQAGGALVGDGGSVPEPGTLALIGLGLAGLLGMRRQKLVR